MKTLIIIISSAFVFGCAGGGSGDSNSGSASTTEETILTGTVEPLKGPCFSGNLNIQPLECNTLVEVGSSTSYSLNGYSDIAYKQTQPKTCAVVSGALSCYSEITKSTTVGTVDLAAYVDFSTTPSFTVNVLSKIVGGCVSTKVKGGLTIDQANLDAKNAFISALGLPADSSYNSFSQLDFKGSEQRNELLVIMSAILQKWGNDDGSGINSAVTQIQNDFADCTLSSSNIAEIWKYGNQVDYASVRSNLIDLYSTKYATAASPADDTGLSAYLKDTDLDEVNNHNDDDTPAAFAFDSVTSAEPYTSYVSNTVTINGLSASGSTSGSFTGGTLTKNGTTASASFTVANLDTFSLSLTSGAFGSTTSASLTVGDTSKTYSVSVRTPSIGSITGTGSAGFSTNMGATWMATKFTPSTSFSAKYLGFDSSCSYSEMSLYSDNSGSPGSELVKSTTINASSYFGSADYNILGGGSSKLIFPSATLAKRYDLLAGTTYWIVVKKTAACNISTYESGVSKYSQDLTNWVAWGTGASKSFVVN